MGGTVFAWRGRLQLQHVLTHLNKASPALKLAVNYAWLVSEFMWKNQRVRFLVEPWWSQPRLFSAGMPLAVWGSLQGNALSSCFPSGHLSLPIAAGVQLGLQTALPSADRLCYHECSSAWSVQELLLVCEVCI